MFGYVLPAKAEMKVRDFEAYRAIYCGLCKQLGKSYGTFSRFLLNYDLVLLAVMADAISGEAGCVNCEGCFANPLAKRKTLHSTNGLSLAADGLAMLSYHKLADNLSDEKPLKRFGYRLAHPFMKRMYKKSKLRNPQLAAVLEHEMQRQREIEAAGSALPDEACEPTAKMCAALFKEAGQTDEQRRALERLGLFCGQIVYLLDAAEDYNDDAANGRYNVFINKGLTFEETVAAVKQRCRMAAGEVALCYNLLPLVQYKDILDNIFFLGLPAGIAAAGIKRAKPNRSKRHGQTESI